MQEGCQSFQNQTCNLRQCLEEQRIKKSGTQNVVVLHGNGSLDFLFKLKDNICGFRRFAVKSEPTFLNQHTYHSIICLNPNDIIYHCTLCNVASHHCQHVHPMRTALLQNQCLKEISASRQETFFVIALVVFKLIIQY